MAKRNQRPSKKAVKAAEPIKEPKVLKVEFIKDFEGQLNNFKVNKLKGDTLEVLPLYAEWLKKHGAIE